MNTHFRMPAKSVLTLTAIAAVLTSINAQPDCNGERYRYTSTHDNVSVSEDHVYGNNVTALGVNTELVFDFYEAVDNAAADRPLIILAHGGFFLAGSNDGADVVPLCEDFARMGYAVASISYRLGIANLLDLENELIRAVWRGVHDGRAAVRYFRKSVEEEGNPWGIDPDRIYMGGVSAGGFLAVHHAYVDDESEIPAIIDQSQPGMGGGLEGESGNPGFSSEVAGIFNVSGALKDANWMQPGDAPLVSVHGTDDGTVPYGSGSVALLGFNVTEVDGSATLHERAEEIGLTHCFVTIDGAGHVPHVTNADAYDVTLSTVAGALSSWICASYPNQCGGYDYTSEIREQVAAAVRMYPNPASGGEVTLVQSNAGGDWVARIRDAQGREVALHRGTGPQSTLNVRSLPAGMYVIDVEAWGWRQPLILR
ncbi:alpha/beta hydrolase fold domain-containing protein [Flavobacteriales bacterium]|nr:alpha/beta hydrolase fold domain-containing protein [Flavobacteriales bacterium]